MNRNLKTVGGKRTSLRKAHHKTVSADRAAARTTPNHAPTTRKTIEIPEEYFFQVKMRALERRMKEKTLWAEIVFEYFQNHPSSRRS